MEKYIDMKLMPFVCDILKRIESDQQVFLKYDKQNKALIPHIVKLIKKKKKKKYKLIILTKNGDNLDFPYSGIQNIKKKVETEKNVEFDGQSEIKDFRLKGVGAKIAGKKLNASKENYEIFEVEEQFIEKSLREDLKRRILPNKKGLLLVEEYSQVASNRLGFIESLINNKNFSLVTFIDTKNRLNVSDTVEIPKVSYEDLQDFIKYSNLNSISDEEAKKILDYTNYQIDYLKEVNTYYKSHKLASFKDDLIYGNISSPLYNYSKEIYGKMRTEEFSKDINLFRKVFIMNKDGYFKISNDFSEKNVMDKLRRLIDGEDICIKDGEKVKIKDIGLKNYILLEDTVDPIIKMYLKESSNGYEDCFLLLEKRKEWRQCLNFYIKNEIVRIYNGDEEYKNRDSAIAEFKRVCNGPFEDSKKIYDSIKLYSDGKYDDAFVKLNSISNTWVNEIKNEIDVLKLLSIIRDNRSSKSNEISKLKNLKNKIEKDDVNLSIRIATKLVGILIDINGDFEGGLAYYKEVEDKVRNSGLEEKYSTNRDLLNILKRKSCLVFEGRGALELTKEAKNYFEKRKNKKQWMYAMCNYSGNCLYTGDFETAIKISSEVIEYIDEVRNGQNQEDYENSLYLNLNNNRILATFFENKNSELAEKEYKELICDSKDIIQMNVLSFRAMNGERAAALAGFYTLYNSIDEAGKIDDFYKYYLLWNRTILEYVENGNKDLSEIEELMPTKIAKEQYIFKRRLKILRDIVNNEQKIDLAENMLCDKGINSKYLLFSDLQVLSD